jgi:hypothetical protein
VSYINAVSAPDKAAVPIAKISSAIKKSINPYPNATIIFHINHKITHTIIDFFLPNISARYQLGISSNTMDIAYIDCNNIISVSDNQLFCQYITSTGIIKHNA